jgi:hypothetical protein
MSDPWIGVHHEHTDEEFPGMYMDNSYLWCLAPVGVAVGHVRYVVQVVARAVWMKYAMWLRQLERKALCNSYMYLEVRNWYK